jgi:hypothetical protein
MHRECPAGGSVQRKSTVVAETVKHTGSMCELTDQQPVYTLVQEETRFLPPQWIDDKTYPFIDDFGRRRAAAKDALPGWEMFKCPLR